jgi:hypothetical protein
VSQFFDHRVIHFHWTNIVKRGHGISSDGPGSVSYNSSFHTDLGY